MRPPFQWETVIKYLGEEHSKYKSSETGKKLDYLQETAKIWVFLSKQAYGAEEEQALWTQFTRWIR